MSDDERAGIHQRLDTLDKSMRDSMETSRVFREQILIDLKDLRHAVVGTTATVGLMERVRGIEKVFDHIRLLWITIIGIIFKTFMDFFGNKGH